MDHKKVIVYELGILAETPRTVTVGKPFRVIYRIRNESNNIFPGGKIPVKISWAALGPRPFVLVPIEINKRLEPGEEFAYKHRETPLASGYTLFTVTKNDFPATDQSGIVRLHLIDGRKLIPGMLFHAVRAKSFEETYTFWALIVSAISLFIIALEKIMGSALFWEGYQVTVVMFIVYVLILYSYVIKTSLSKTSIVFRIALTSISFGLLSYASVQIFNSIELLFMDTKGIIHVILVGPLQEEIVKFAFLLLTFSFVKRLDLKKKSFDLNADLKGSVLVGAIIGLILATLENLIDYGHLNPANTFLRTLVSWPLHILTTVISVYGLHKFHTTGKVHTAVTMLSTAIVVHVVFNFSLLLFGF